MLSQLRNVAKIHLYPHGQGATLVSIDHLEEAPDLFVSDALFGLSVAPAPTIVRQIIHHSLNLVFRW